MFPAVEALQSLARVAREHQPELNVQCSSEARFFRFLQVDPEAGSAEAVVDLEPLNSGAVRASLLTVKRAGKSGITRSVEHVTATFGGGDLPCEVAPFSQEPELPGLTITGAQLYDELVPFGPAYRNAHGPVELWPDRAAAPVICPGLPGSRGPLGSPFPLDAALHVACAWGQRYLGQVLFPTGYAERQILRPTEPGERYHCEVRPLPGDSPAAGRFDICLRDETEQLRERCKGVRMEDVSRGKLTPPPWVRPCT